MSQLFYFLFRSSKKRIFLATAVVYLICVRLLRYRRLKYLQTLDPEKDLYTLAGSGAKVEFPWLANKAVEFALFKTYGVPSISRLLLATGELVGKNLPKRFDDTELIIREMFEHPLDHPRAVLAIQRLNYLHGRYSISNDDYLYTLCLFITEPAKWIAKYEWRKLDEKEQMAAYSYWSRIGVSMGIKNIPASFEQCLKWQQEYEKDHLVYAKSNQKVADQLLGMYVGSLPFFMRGIALKAVCAMMEPKLRSAVGSPEPPSWLISLLEALLWLRKMAIRHLALPRPQFLAPLRTGKMDATGRCFQNFYNYENIYPDGYLIDHLGPASAVGGALKPICPFAPDSIKSLS